MALLKIFKNGLCSSIFSKRALLGLSLFYFSYFNLCATTYNWSGSTSGSQAWSTGTNWTPNGTPFTGDTATINKTSSAATSFTVTMGEQSINNLTLTSGTTGNQVIGMSGGSLEINSGGSFNVNVGSATSLTANFSSSLNFPAFSSRSLTFDISSNAILNLSSSYTPPLPELPGILSFNKTGSGTLNIANSNTFPNTTNTTISAGVLLLSANPTFIGNGSSTFALNSGSLVLAPSIGTTTIRDLSGNAGTTINFNNNNLFISQSSGATYAGIITGAAGIFFEGPAATPNFILTGANDYTGATVINRLNVILSGADSALGNNSNVILGFTTNAFHYLTLETDAGAKSIGSLSGNFTSGIIDLNNNRLTINQSTDQDYYGTIIGTGGITKQGSANLNLQSAVTYSGTTIISNGTLTFSADTSNLTGTMTNNAAVVFSQTANSSFGQAISGTGSLTKSGAGNLTLSASNSYSGITTISSGTLTFTASTSSLGGAMTNNAAVVFNQSASSTFGQIISGTGTLTKQGSGTLTLTAANNYTGATTIAGGVIALSGASATLGNNSALNLSGGDLHIEIDASDQTIGPLSGNSASSEIIFAGTTNLTINQSTSQTYAGKFSGNGSKIIKLGSENLTLTGSSPDFIGEIEVDNGTLSVAGVMSGLGEAMNTFVNTGTLNVSGTLYGTTTAQAGGIIQGTGHLDNVINNGGTIAPGNSIGTLYIDGNLTISGASSILEIELNNLGQTDFVSITGTAQLNGYIQAFPAAGVYTKGMQFLVLTANGGISGNFVGIEENHPQEFSIRKIGNSIYILVDVATAQSPFVALLQGNALLTYEYLFSDLLGNNLALLNLQNTLLNLPTLEALSQALVELCPAIFSALPLVELQNNVHMAQVVNQKNRKFLCDGVCEKNRMSLWMEPIGLYYNQKGVQQQYGFHNYTYGAAIGTLIPFNQHYFTNLALGYTQTNVHWNNQLGHAHANSFYIAQDVGYFDDCFFLSVVVQGDFNFYKAKRNIQFTGYHEQATHWHNSYGLLCGFDIGAKWEINDLFTSNKPNYHFLTNDRDHYSSCSHKSYQGAEYAFYIQPELEFYFLNLFQNRFKEIGAPNLNLSVSRKYNAFLQPSIKLKCIQQINIKNFCLAPNIYIGYLANIPLSNPRYVSIMYDLDITTASNFYVNGYQRLVNQLTYGAEFILRTCHGFLFTLNYQSTALSHMMTQAVTFKLSWQF